MNSAIWFWLNIENTLELDLTAFFFEPAISVPLWGLFGLKNSCDAYGPLEISESTAKNTLRSLFRSTSNTVRQTWLSLEIEMGKQ